MPRRIDLHVHTVSSELDTDFGFSMDALERHVESNGLSAIAITNHNLFDRGNYELIRDTLRDVLVLPGVEVSVETYHVLYVTSRRNVDRLERMCEELAGIERGERGMGLDRFMGSSATEAASSSPHYGKSPSIREDDLASMFPYVGALEVGSEKKWARAYADDGRYASRS